MRNDTELSPAAVGSFVRGELARSLRSQKPYYVNLLLGGVDPITNEPSLQWLDYLAARAVVPYAAHGYAQYVDPPPPVCPIFNRMVKKPCIADATLDTIASQSSINIIIQTLI
jgi:hypothetical protein